MNKPIFFNTASVQAILAGRKTETRRLVKPQPASEKYQICTSLSDNKRERGKHFWAILDDDNSVISIQAPLFSAPYTVGDVVWVRETWNAIESMELGSGKDFIHAKYVYRANQVDCNEYPGIAWRASIHMPKKAARIFLKIISVRVEHIAEFSWTPTRAEGCHCFETTWDAIYAKRGLGWAENPWVYVIGFEQTINTVSEVNDGGMY